MDKTFMKKLASNLIIAVMMVALGVILYTQFQRSKWIILLTVLSVVVIALEFVFHEMFWNMFNKAVRWRWLIALIIFILCVFLRLHGSSIGMYNNDFPTQTDAEETDDYYVFGYDRQIRSDEWVVHTATYFSQYYNDYQVTSQQMSIGDTNMIMDYYAPAKDITAIGKPFSWGYFLFGNEVGLSWYWCGLQIMLFMSAFEMFLILTKNYLL